jgi:hypothetical protein
MPQQVNLVITDISLCDDLLKAWVQAGVPGLTIVDSSGLAHALQGRGMRDDLPLFPSMRRLLQESEQRSRLIFTVVPDEFDLDHLVEETERILGPLQDEHSGFMFIIPVSRVVGLRPSRPPENLPDE